MNQNDLKVGFGVFELSKAELSSRVGEMEDRSFVDEADLMFGIFDGLDGEKGAGAAAEVAFQATNSILRQYEAPTTASNLVWMMGLIDQKLREDIEAGGTSCVLARIIGNENERKMIFGAIGDSRIYLKRNDEVIQITIDDGLRPKDLDAMGISDPVERKRLSEVKVRKYLNSGEKFEVSYNNSGEVWLKKGDRILICSDGVSGENVETRLTNENILSVFSRNFDDETTAKIFVKIGRKNDDRTAIVISVN